MNCDTKSMQQINAQCRNRTASVVTETELWERVRSGAGADALDMDVVVFAFSASMHGCSAMLLVPVAGKGVFTRAESILLNGVPAYPGPAPNERLGVVDSQMFADQNVEDVPEGAMSPGARVLLDVLDNKTIQVECVSVEGGSYRNAFRRDELEYARMVSYDTSLPPWLNIAPDGRPQEHLAMVRAGGTVFLNRAPGVVIGSGTRSAPGKASLSLSADMLQMDPECVGRDGEGVMSIVVPIPVVNGAVKQSILNSLAEVSESRLAQWVQPKDRVMGSHVKGLIMKGECIVTNSSLPIHGFE
jgi:uncharacterized protein (DUF39 family)